MHVIYWFPRNVSVQGIPVTALTVAVRVSQPFNSHNHYCRRNEQVNLAVVESTLQLIKADYEYRSYEE